MSQIIVELAKKLSDVEAALGKAKSHSRSGFTVMASGRDSDGDQFSTPIVSLTHAEVMDFLEKRKADLIFAMSQEFKQGTGTRRGVTENGG